MKHSTHIFFVFVISATSIIPSITAMHYDSFTNNRIMLDQLKKIPAIIQESIETLRYTHTFNAWDLPTISNPEEWNPREYPYSAATIQGCLMEFEHAIPRALITPWGRIMLTTKGNNSCIKKIASIASQHILFGNECPELISIWNPTNHRSSGVFEIQAIDSVALEPVILRKHINEAVAQKISHDWEKATAEDLYSYEPEIIKILSSSPVMKYLSNSPVAKKSYMQK